MITKQGIGSGVRRDAKPASAPARAAFDAIIHSAVGIVRESGGLVSNIAALSIALVVNTTAAAPTRRRGGPRAANVIPFPTDRGSATRNRPV